MKIHHITLWLLARRAAAIMLALALLVTTAASPALAQDPEGSLAPTPDRQPPIRWTPPSVEASVAPGDTYVTNIQFVSSLTIQDAVIQITLPLSRYARVEPRGPMLVTAGQPIPLVLTITMPAEILTDAQAEDTVAVTIHGLIMVAARGRVYPNFLPVTIHRIPARPPIEWTPPAVRLQVPITGSVSTDVSFTSSITIENATLRATPPISRFLTIDPVGPMTILPGVPITVHLTASRPPLEVAPTTLIVGGLVQVTTPAPGDSHDVKVWPHSLLVTLIFGAPPEPTPPPIHWRPPVVTITYRPDGDNTRVVTVTSSITLTNATLEMSEPLRHVLEVSPTSLNLEPGVPQQVTLTAKAPPTSAPLVVNGEVRVLTSDGHRLQHTLKVTVVYRRQPTTP